MFWLRIADHYERKLRLPFYAAKKISPESSSPNFPEPGYGLRRDFILHAASQCFARRVIKRPPIRNPLKIEVRTLCRERIAYRAYETPVMSSKTHPSIALRATA